MKSFLKSAISIAALALCTSLPVAASAASVGVSNETDTTVITGNVCQSSSSTSWTNGVESTTSTATKSGTANDSGSNSGSAVDPASSATAINGNYNENATTTATSSGTYGTYNTSSTSLSNGKEVQTQVTNTVSTFTNP